nr:HigA family addiction module antidote protein [Acidobacteriota bacterium]
MHIYRPVHPGEILKEFITGDVTVTSLAKHIDYPRGNLSRVINGKLGIAPSLAVKLSEAFPNQDAEFWMNLQNSYELALVRKEKRKKIRPILTSTQAAA